MSSLRPSMRWIMALAGVAVSCGDSSGRVTDSATGTSVTSVSTGDTTSGTSSGSSSGEPVTTSGDPTGSSGTTGQVTSATGSSGGPDSTTTTTTTGTTTDPGSSSGGGPPGCKQVDFLFVIDNSVSMEGEQAELTAAFPAFIDTIKNTLPTSDYHIMVVDTDDTGRCSPTMCTHSTCQAAGKYACMDIFTECDKTRGAGVVHPAGEFTANMPCDFEPGKRYLLSSDPDLTANFECAAKVGTAGNASERPMDGMVEALSPALAGPGGCNEGFLRDDAILVVTFISDDNAVEDVNTAQQTFDAVVAAKGGDVDRIVMLGLISGDGCGTGGKHWADMISMFGPRGIKGSVCSMEYNTFFQDAVSTILDTCIINPG